MVDVFFEASVDGRAQYCGKIVPPALNRLSAIRIGHNIEAGLKRQDYFT
jgi:hypothetical protein